jgi:hypothetical protein
MNIEQTVAKNVRTICGKQGIPLLRLASKLGIERGNFYTMLNTGIVKISTAVALAQALGVEPADLMFGDFDHD